MSVCYSNPFKFYLKHIFYCILVVLSYRLNDYFLFPYGYMVANESVNLEVLI